MSHALFRESAYPLSDAPYIQKPISVVDSTFDLYGFLPADGDPRWPFLYRYDQIKRGVGFKSVHFANAWGATYLSETPSYRVGFVSSISSENCLQLDRALDNLGEAKNVAERYKSSAEAYEAYDMRLARTDQLTADPTKQR